MIKIKIQADFGDKPIDTSTFASLMQQTRHQVVQAFHPAMNPRLITAEIEAYVPYTNAANIAFDLNKFLPDRSQPIVVTEI